MRRRAFIGCAAAMSLVPCQGTSAEPGRGVAKRVPPRPEKPAGKLGLTHPTVDIAIVCSHFKESLRFYGCGLVSTYWSLKKGLPPSKL